MMQYYNIINNLIDEFWFFQVLYNSLIYQLNVELNHDGLINLYTLKSPELPREDGTNCIYKNTEVLFSTKHLQRMQRRFEEEMQHELSGRL